MGDADKLKIIVDQEECIGDGACVDDAPGTFEMNDDDKAVVKTPPSDSPDAIMEAAKNCPTDCISLVDTESGKQLYPEE